MQNLNELSAVKDCIFSSSRFMLLYFDMLAIFLGSLVLLFLLVVFAYFMVRIDKKNKIVNAEFIRGTWERKGKSPEGQAWFFQYKFDRDQFTMRGEPAFQLAGNYKVIKEIENLLRLELYNLQGESDTPRKMLNISIDKKSNRLNIDGRDFLRIKS